MYKTPILLLFFNRPETTQKVFDQIKQVKPLQLFVSCDGARKGNSEDEKAIKKCKEILETIDWECEVKYNYYTDNQGCNLAVTGGISWFFKNVDKGIILEDDCLPSSYFFNFCEEMLSKYEHDNRISIISGTNFLPNSKKINYDYYFSTLTHIWGWATWKRTWDENVLNITNYQEVKTKNGFLKYKYKKLYINFFNYLFEKVAKDPHCDVTWDYRFFYHNLVNNRLSIIPAVNLVNNIGFDGNGRSGVKKRTESIQLNPQSFKTCNYTQPVSFIPELEFDNYTLLKELKYGIVGTKFALLIKSYLEKKPTLKSKVRRLINKI